MIKTSAMVCYCVLLLLLRPGQCFDSGLFSFARASGASVDRVQVTTANGVRGLAPLVPTVAGQELMSVPRSLLLRPSRARAVGVGRVPAALYDRSSPKQQLALTLLAEATRVLSGAAASKDAPWPAAYLACLPNAASFTGVAAKWTDDELAWLGSPIFAARAQSRRATRAQLCAALTADAAGWAQHAPGSWRVEHALPPGAPPEAMVEWCVDVATSRALGGTFGSGGWTRRLVGLQLGSVAVATAGPAVTSGFFLADPPTSAAVPLAPLALLAAALLLLVPVAAAVALLRVGTREEVAFVPVLDLVNHSSARKAARLSYGLVQVFTPPYLSLIAKIV